MTIQHKRWFTLRGVDESAVAIFLVWHTEPIMGCILIPVGTGTKITVHSIGVDPEEITDTIRMEIVGSLDSKGIINYDSSTMLTHRSITEAEYGTYLAFDLLPVLPFSHHGDNQA
jgi:hypothetical protein